MSENTRGRRGSTFQAWSLPDLFPSGCSGIESEKPYACRSSESSPASCSHGGGRTTPPSAESRVAVPASAIESKNHWPLSVRRPILRNEYLVFVMNDLDGGAVDEPGLMLFCLSRVGTS